MGRSRPTPPPPLLLVALAVLGAARADGDLSLHPPYFNLAEGARIAASATCGEEAPARGSPRPTEDLYCKLVGGPVAGGDPNQTIQVSAGGGSPRAGCDRVRALQLQADLTGTEAPASLPDPPAPRFREQKGPQRGHSGCARELRAPVAPRLPGGRAAAFRRGLRGEGAGWCPDFGGPSLWVRAR